MLTSAWSGPAQPTAVPTCRSGPGCSVGDGVVICAGYQEQSQSPRRPHCQTTHACPPPLTHTHTHTHTGARQVHQGQATGSESTLRPRPTRCFHCRLHECAGGGTGRQFASQRAHRAPEAIAACVAQCAAHTRSHVSLLLLCDDDRAFRAEELNQEAFHLVNARRTV